MNYFKICAYFENETSGFIEDSTNTLPAPSNLICTQQNAHTFELNWDDNSQFEQGFKIDRKIDEEDWINNIHSTPQNATSWIDSTVVINSNIVYYRIYAFFNNFKSDSIDIHYNITFPAPSNLTLQKLDQNKIKLSWQDNSEGEVGFHIDKKIGGTDWVTNYATVDSNTVSFIDNITETCGTFYYRVKAYSGTYISANSNEAQINILLDLIGSVNTPGVAQDIITSGWYAYVPDNYEGLQIIYFGNPEIPEIVHTMNDFEGRVLSADVEDDFLYVTSHISSTAPGVITSVDITNPLNPQISGSSLTSGIPYDIEVVGDFAYISDGDNGLTIFFILNSTPDFVTNVSSSGHAQSICVDGTNAYIAQGLDGIAIFDITDPFNPSLSATYSTTGAKDIFVQNNYAFIADSEDGLLILDVSNPALPTYVAEVETDGFVTGVHVDNSYAYISDSEIGLVAIDISSIINPCIIGYYEMIAEPSSLILSGSYALLIDNEGMKIVQVSP